MAGGAMKHLCPVCRRAARQTRRGNVWSHYDSIRSGVCPGAGQPWHITMISEPESSWVAG